MENLLGSRWRDDYPASLTQREKDVLEQVLLERLKRNTDDNHYSALCSYLQAINLVRKYPLDDQGE